MLAIAIPILYVLSPGPLLWLIYESDLDLPNWLIAGSVSVLSPLAFLYENVDWVGDFYDAYFQLLDLSP